MYHVYCESHEVEAFTPDWNDAKRKFRAYVREFPDELVKVDTLDEFRGPDDYRYRENVMQCDPYDGDDDRVKQGLGQWNASEAV